MIEKAKRMAAFKPGIFADLKKEKEDWQKTHSEKVIDFSIGSPDIPPEPGIIKAITDAAADPKNYRYAITALPEMTEEIRKWYKERYGTDLGDDEIALLQGSQEALGALPQIFINEGDGVLIPDPYYPIYADSARLAGGDVLFMPLKPENDYLIDFDAIPEKDLAKAKMMIVSYPNNPTGATAPDSFYEKLIAFAKKHNILVVHDNAYSDLVFDGKKGRSFLSFPGAKEVGIELNSFSKSYGMAGARLGVLVGNKDVVKAYKDYKSNMDYGIFLPVQYGGIEALKHGGSSIEENRKTYAHRRDVLVDAFGKAGWQIPKSGGTMFVWAPIPASYADADAFAHDLLNKTGLVVTPGTRFGKEGQRFVRIALVEDDAAIEEAARRIAPFFEKLAQEEDQKLAAEKKPAADKQ